MHYHAPVEMGKSLMNVIGGYFECVHTGHFTQSTEARCKQFRRNVIRSDRAVIFNKHQGKVAVQRSVEIGLIFQASLPKKQA
jgi:hypothetical protein